MFRLHNLRMFDIFAPPYQQKIYEDSFKRKTIAGGILSLFLLLICFGYLLYLFNLYTTGKYQPKQNDYEQQTHTEKQLDIKFSDISLFIYNNDQSLNQLESDKKIQYFLIQMNIIENSKIIKSIQAEECFDDTMAKNFGLKQGYFYCFNKDNQGDSVTLYSDEYSTTLFKIEIQYCNPNFLKTGYRCASQAETNSYLYNQNNFFQISLETEIYDIHQDKHIKTNYTQDLYSRTDEVLNNTISLKLLRLQVSKGHIFQTTDERQYFYNLENSNFYFPQNSNSVLNPFSTTVKLDRTIKYESIQYIPITQIFAEAWTIISLILVIGNIVRIISESSFMQDLMQIQLKFYYKKTAKKLFSQNQDQFLSYKDDTTRVIETNEQIQQTNYKKNIQNYFNLSKWQKFSIFYLPRFCRKRKNKSEEEMLLDELIKQTHCEMNLYEMQKELLKMKLLIKLLVTPEQYAAIQMCGCDLLQQNPLNQNNQNLQSRDKKIKSDSEVEMVKLENKVQTETNYDLVTLQIGDKIVDQKGLRIKSNDLLTLNIEDNNCQEKKPNIEILPQLKQPLNHLEILNKIDIDNQFKKQCLSKFLSIDYNDSSNQKLNERIKNCMIGIDSNNLQVRKVLQFNYEIEQHQLDL